MRNRKQRHNQRAYKYQEQERVPECWNDTYYDPYDEYWSDIGDSHGCHCGFCVSKRYDEWMSKEGVSADWMSVDSADEDCDDTEYRLLDKEETSLVARAGDKQDQPVMCLNRYALLNEEAETSSDESEEDNQGPEICLNREEKVEDTLNGKTVEDKSDWNVVCYSKDVQKQINIRRRRIAAALAYNERLIPVCNPADVQKWVDSWCNDDNDEIPIIHTDGLFRKNGKAGYGVIVRSRSGVPLAGSAGVYTQGKPVSALYHELQGINRGLELAIKYGLHKKVKIYCNSHLAADLFASGFRCYCEAAHYPLTMHDIVCRLCVRRCIPECSEEDFQLLMYPLIQEIGLNYSMLSFTVEAVRRRQNRAADYLAKLLLKKYEIEPHEFPQELKAILYEDAQGGDLMPYVPRHRAWFLDW